MTQILESLKHYCRQEAETADLAKRLAVSLGLSMTQNPESHFNISLEGDLGAGKTTFARYLIQGMGHSGRVKSPTYTLCEPYPIQINNQRFTIHHFDLYRMRDPLEWQEVGFSEHFDLPGFCVIEWPEKAQGTLPAFDIQIELIPSTDENERTITINALSQQGQQVMLAIKANNS